MRRIQKSRLSLSVGAMLAAVSFAAIETPAAAQAVDEITVMGRYGADGEPSSLSRPVSFADLDLRMEADRAELASRVKLTARELCEQLGEPATSTAGPVPSCRDAAIRQAMGEVRAAVDYARSDPNYRAPRMAEASLPENTPAYDMPAAPAATSYGQEASVTVSTVTNGAIPDTPENRARYGGPMSRGGAGTAPAGN